MRLTNYFSYFLKIQVNMLDEMLIFDQTTSNNKSVICTRYRFSRENNLRQSEKKDNFFSSASAEHSYKADIG